MLTIHEQQLKKIVAAVSISDISTYAIDQQTHHIYRTKAIEQYVGNIKDFGTNTDYALGEDYHLLIKEMSHMLYRQFYAGMDMTQRQRVLPPGRERNAFMEQLSLANQSQEGLDVNWTIYHINNNKEIFAKKNEQLRAAQLHEFVSKKDKNDLEVGDNIDFYVLKESKTIQKVFYHVYGSAYFDRTCDMMRIYWNMQPKGAVLLIELLTKLFNAYQVPFSFKCINHELLYDRHDNGVLYFSKDNLTIVRLLIKRIIVKMQPYLKTAIPLFTKKIVDGVSIAEDPGHGRSFGQSRCEAIAEALVLAFTNKIDEKQRFDFVCQTLSQKGIEPKQMAFHPHSKHYLLDTAWI